MPAKLTTQEFIDRARVVHGDKYGYAFSVYQSAHINVYIHCPEHKMFEQNVNQHLCGYSCPQCSVEKTQTVIMKTEQEKRELIEYVKSNHNCYLHRKHKKMNEDDLFLLEQEADTIAAEWLDKNIPWWKEKNTARTNKLYVTELDDDQTE